MQLRLAQPHFVLAQPLFARRRSCASRNAERGAHLRVVEPREDLALRDGHAFLDDHLDDLAGDLRGHRRPPPRGDVARGVQHRARRRPAAPICA